MSSSKYHGKYNEWDHKQEQLDRIEEREFAKEVTEQVTEEVNLDGKRDT